MNDINPTIIVALITAVFSLIIAIISLYGNRESEKKKLKNLIKNQEYQNRINALHTAIEIIQKIKNELRQIADLLENSLDYDKNESAQSIRDLIKSFRDNYSSKLSSLHKEEATMLHEITSPLHALQALIDGLSRRPLLMKNNLNERRTIDEIMFQRERLSFFQEEYRRIRRKIIDVENI